LMDRLLPIPAYVASLAPRDAEDARRLVARVHAGANAVEFRMDLADRNIPPAALLGLDPRPVILTWRSMAEGGNFNGSPEEYARLIEEAYAAGATVDVEHARGLLADPRRFAERARVVASLHSPFSLPADWNATVTTMKESRARAVKLVAGAADVAGGLRVAELQRGIGDPSVSIFPMGPASAPGRVLSALFGAALVYGPVERETAPGQIPIGDLLSIYEVDRRRPLEALFGVVSGNTAKSLSPYLYNALFRARELPYLYLPLQISDFGRERPQEMVFDPPFRGFAVTQPWKLEAARAGIPSEDVRVIGASNTLVRDRSSNGWRAENTDVDGVFDPLADHGTGEGRTAVVVGAGGAARAVVVAARRLGYEILVTARRDAEADRLAEEMRVDSLAWGDLAASEADLYVNATPVGWRDEDPPAIPPSLLEPKPLVFDCVYRRDGRETSTIRAARAAKCPVVEGLQMFAAQAVRQAQLFGLGDVTLQEVTALLQDGRG
jgi:shikimate dehydrogenase/3-dehydroquinate dehydratase type I